MPTDADVVKLEVIVYPDGGTQVSVPPMEALKLASMLQSAAVAIRCAADSAARDLDLVVCSQCGEAVAGIRAAADGNATLQPCGHKPS